jgi:hypothetical protein
MMRMIISIIGTTKGANLKRKEEKLIQLGVLRKEFWDELHMTSMLRRRKRNFDQIGARSGW